MFRRFLRFVGLCRRPTELLISAELKRIPRMADYTFPLTVGQKDHLHFSGLDNVGHPIAIPAASVSVDNPAVATIVPDADGLGVEVTAVSAGTALLTITDEGLTATVEIPVSAPVPAKIVVTADAPVAA